MRMRVARHAQLPSALSRWLGCGHFMPVRNLWVEPQAVAADVQLGEADDYRPPYRSIAVHQAHGLRTQSA